MKIRLIGAVLMLSLAAPGYAMDMDITHNPNKDFLVGYEHKYQDDCDVHWWESQWGTQHIFSLGKCKGVSDEHMVDDMMDLMHQIKATTKFKNFAEYFDDQKKKSAVIAEANKLRCVNDASGTYVFLPAASATKPGWFYIEKMYNGQGMHSGTVGLWKHGANGAIVADFGPTLVNINMANVYDCRNP
jgi:hypothetical protein